MISAPSPALSVDTFGPTAYECAVWREDRLVQSRGDGGKKG